MVDPSKNIQIKRLKLLLLVSSLVSLVLLLMSAFEENIKGEWRIHQAAYQQALTLRAKNPKEKLAAKNMAIGFKQLYLPDLHRVDRCVTCHVAIEDPAQTEAEQPIRVHSGTTLKNHPIDKFGCTVCHDGQGLAVDKDAAHGDVEHWLKPMLAGKKVYVNCSKCHFEGDLFGAEDDLFVQKDNHLPINQQELKASVPGADVIARGKQLVLRSGCLGCHKYRGRGGQLGPDITLVGNKTAHDFDFKNVSGEHSTEQWLFQHFKNPKQVSTGSLMPNLNLSDAQAHDLTQYMLNLQSKKLPASYTPIPPRRGGELATGKQLYGIFCASCHGSDGKGSTVRDANTSRGIDAPAQLMVPSLNHLDTLAVASDDYLRFIIQHGRSNTDMINWLTGTSPVAGGLQVDEVDRIVKYIRHWQRPAQSLEAIDAKRGDAKLGRYIYKLNCTGCHGRKGQGGIGPSLNSPSFLSIASDTYLAKTITNGRPNTAMTGYRHLSTQQISDLIAYIRHWHPKNADRTETLRAVAQPASADISPRIGKILFRNNCVTCHGAYGQGDLGPSINTQAFLTIADNDYLFTALTQGRPGTAMPAWQHLSSEDIASLIKYIRTWQNKKSITLDSGSIPGDPQAGQLVYNNACTACHGSVGQGVVGPAIGNPIFLKSASDKMLKRWISYGKTSTAMLGFLKGQQGPVELRESQIDDLISYLRTLPNQAWKTIARNPSGRPELGEGWYRNSCAGCHGEKGEGASAQSLSNPNFLNAASDGFILATLALGRDGTDMRPVKKGPESILALSSDQVNDIVAYIRSWEIDSPVKGIPHRYVIPSSLQRGKTLYESDCSGCHGINGKPEKSEPGLSAWAPHLNNEEFLQAATDGFLQATIVRGRMGTSMRPFGKGSQGIVELSMSEIDDIVAYIRQWSSKAPSPMTLLNQQKSTKKKSSTN